VLVDALVRDAYRAHFALRGEHLRARVAVDPDSEVICAAEVSPATTADAAIAPTLPGDRLPAAWHRTDRYANNRVEADHGRLKARLRPMRGLQQDRSARIVIAGHAFVQNVRRGHYELAVEELAIRRLAVAFDELAVAI
jgi:hypothetical protein